MVGAWRLFLLLVVAGPLLMSRAPLSAAEMDAKQLFDLARQLEDLGYMDSARSYYERLFRDPKVQGEFLSEVENRLAALDKALEKRPPKKGLEPLEGFSSFRLSPPGDAVPPERPLPLPQEFPTTHINKKAWLFGTLIVVGVSGMLYYRQLQKKPAPPAAAAAQPPPETPLTIEF